MHLESLFIFLLLRLGIDKAFHFFKHTFSKVQNFQSSQSDVYLFKLGEKTLFEESSAVLLFKSQNEHLRFVSGRPAQNYQYGFFSVTGY